MAAEGKVLHISPAVIDVVFYLYLPIFITRIVNSNISEATLSEDKNKLQALVLIILCYLLFQTRGKPAG